MNGQGLDSSDSTGSTTQEYSTEDFDYSSDPAGHTEVFNSGDDSVDQEVGEANVILIAHPEHRRLGTRYRLSRGSSLDIGRARAADLSFSEVPSISRLHARLSYRGDGVTLEDLGSTNGTYVNDQLIHSRVTLKSGDRFQAGSVYFKFLLEQDVEAAYYETIHQLAIRDGLTEIYNKRRFDEELDREFRRAKRHGRPLGLLIFDIDRFKLVNDNFGHLCGDYILHELAKLCSDLLRHEQLFARVGGDEFAILSPEVAAENTAILAEKVRQQIAVKIWKYAGRQVAVTCSFGVADVAPEHQAPSDLYDAADRALYEAKESGRNAVRVSASSPNA